MERILEQRDLTVFPEMIARAEPGEDVIRITGYGSVFNKPYDVWGIREVVEPGAFTKTLRDNPDIRGMFNHSPDFLLGRTKSKTMDVEEDAKGLRYEIRADPQDPQAASVARKIARGDVDGSSMAFFVHREEWERDKDGRPTKRILREIELIETGPVTMPASPATSAKVKRSAEIGYDDALVAVMVMHRAGFNLSSAQEEMLRRTIETLERLKAAPLNQKEEHPVTGTQLVDHELRRLALRREEIAQLL
jgi:HK97 family phage prohead protease